jgi:hypothetical protein
LILAGAVVVVAALAWVRPQAFGSGLETKLAHWQLVLGRAPSGAEVFVGRGPGTYGTVASAAMPPAAWSKYAHNWAVETWVEQGFLGLLPLVGFVAVSCFACVRAASGGSGRWGWAVSVAWIAGLIHRLVDFDYNLPAVSFPWWCMAGWLAASVRPRSSSLAGKLRVGTAAVGSVVRRSLPVLVPVLILPLIFLRGTPAVLWEAAVLGAAVAAFWAARCLGALRPVAGRADIPWVLLLVLAGGWALFSSRPDASCTALLTAVGLVALLLLLRGLSRMDRRVEPAMRWAVVAMGVVVGLWGIGEAVLTRQPGRASFPSPNFLGAFLVFTGGLAVGSWRAARGPARTFAGIAAVVSAAGIVATGSAGAGLAACAVATVWLCVSAVRSRGMRRMAALIGAAVVVLVAGWGASRIDGLSLAQRLTMWHEATRLIVAAPGGWGPGSYSDAVLRVQEPSITAAGVGRYSLVAEFAHCEPLQFAAEWGIAGLGVLVWGLALAWLAAGRGAASAWRVALACVLVHGFVDFPLRAPPILVLAVVALAFMTVRARPPVVGAGGKAAAGGVAVCLGLAVWLGITWMRPALARWAGDRAAGPWNTPTAGQQMLVTSAWPLSVTGPTRVRAPGWWVWTAIARTRMERRDWRGAQAAINEALAREPMCLEAYVVRGLLAEKRGDRAGARRWYRRALLLRARLVQRPGLNDYERSLVGYSSNWERHVRGLLLNVGGER